MKTHRRQLSAPVAYLSRSGWCDRPSNVAPGLSGDVSCDVAIVGGGLGGMSAALRFAELGMDVCLMEADVLGGAASGRNGGYLTNVLGSDPRILSRFYADRLRGLLRFAENGLAFTEELIERRAIECDYRQSGLFTAAVTAAQLKHMRRTIKPGGRTRVLDHKEAGVPKEFRGGMHTNVGGLIDPGKLALGLREAVLASGARTFEQTPVHRIQDDGGAVRIHGRAGTVRAKRVLLTTNAGTRDLGAAPRWVSRPLWTTMVETEPVSDELLDVIGWTSRVPIVTGHLVFEGYRPTSRGTILLSGQRFERPRGPVGDRQPDEAIVAGLVGAFRKRFPGLEAVQPARAWGGWISMTPSNFAVVGQVSPRVYYSMACNGHGVPQAPYLGHLMADHLTGLEMHTDLKAVWRKKARFAPGAVNATTLTAAWMIDRLTDALDERRAR